MSIYNTKKVKLFLSGIFFLMVSVASHASEGVIYYGNADIVGKEHLFIGNASENKDTLKEQNSQAEILSNDNPNIYIAKNAKIFIADSSSIVIVKNAKELYDREHLADKQNIRQIFAKTNTKIKRKKSEPVKNEIAEKEAPEEIVVPDFPFEPFSPSYLQCGKESEVAALQNKLDKNETVSKTYRATYQCNENSDLSIYLPEQRQKLSTLATQCGMLTLISPNSPPLL